MVRVLVLALGLGACGAAWDSDEYGADRYGGTWRVTGGERIDYNQGRPGPVEQRAAGGEFTFEMDTDGDGAQIVTHSPALYDLAQWGPLVRGNADRQLPDGTYFSYWFWDEHDSRLFFANDGNNQSHYLTAITLSDYEGDEMTWLYVELDGDPTATERRLLVREEIRLEK